MEDAAEKIRQQYDVEQARERLRKDAKRAEFLERAVRLSREDPK